jgi:hypothetical protein
MNKERFEYEMSKLDPMAQIRFQLQHMNFLKEETKAKTDVKTNTVPCEKEKQCCDHPQIVYIETGHDEVCQNCGIANHCGPKLFSGQHHFEDMSNISCLVTNRTYYKRETHFRRLLRDFQGGHVKTPQAIWDALRDETERPITVANILKVLKEYKWVRFYNHAKYYASVLRKKFALPCLSSEQQLRLMNRFMAYSNAFDCWKVQSRTKRNNFLSYSLLLFNLCKELKYNHVLAYIKLPKGRRTIIAQNEIWKILQTHYVKDTTYQLPYSLPHEEDIHEADLEEED